MKRRLRSARLSSIMSISLVLLLVGMASLMLVNAKSVTDYFKENVKLSVVMKPEISDEQTQSYQTVLDSYPFVKSSDFISKAQGISEMSEMLGNDFLSVFEVSPIPSSIDISLNAEYVSTDSLNVVKGLILQNSMVDEVEYQTSLIEALNENIRKISIFLAVLIALLMFISFVLINNTVRLGVFAKRFTIHTMQMVGATRSFIRAPFLLNAVFEGLFSAFIAIAMLLAGMFVIREEFVQLFSIFKLELLLLVMGIVVVSGVLICVVSTCLVVNKLVASGKDELYI